MSEVEFDLLLDVVQTAVAADPDESGQPFRFNAPMAANDNEAAWPLMPFPEGWYASC